MTNFQSFLSSVFTPRAIRRSASGHRLKLLPLEPRIAPAVLVVTSLDDSVADDGKLTLREAVLSANNNAPVNPSVVSTGIYGRDTISFASGLVGRLALIAPLPGISDSAGLVLVGNPNVTIDASGAGSTPLVVNSANVEIRGMTIQGSPANAIVLNPGARQTIVAANRIGTDASGAVVAASGNRGAGILIAGATDATIGGINPDDANTIGGSGAAGVAVTGVATGYRILGNSFLSNGGPAIDIGGDGAGTASANPAARTASPILTQVVPTSATVRTAYGTASGASGSTQRIEFYAAAAFDANGLAQGRTLLGSLAVAIGASGTAAFTFAYAPVADRPILTATATDGAGNTSEFSGRNRAPIVNGPADRTVPAGAANLVFDGANGISITDPGNAGTGPVRARAYATGGTVTLGNLSGVGIESGANGSIGVTITGSLAGVNRALAGLTFTPTVGFSGLAVVGVRIDDLAGDALGGSISTERNIRVTVPVGTGGTGGGGTGGTTVAPPIVTVSPASGNVGTPIALSIGVSLATSNATDRINTIGIKNLPVGATLSAGTRLSDGSWLLTQAQLVGLTITSPLAGSFDLSVSATTRTTLDDSISATTKSLTLTVGVGVGGTIPLATIDSGPGTVSEGDSATFSGHFTVAAGLASSGYQYLWTLAGSDGQIVRSEPGTAAANGAISDFKVFPPASGMYTVSLTVTGPGGATSTAARGLNVSDVKPTVTILGPDTIVAGQSATYTGAFTDPGADGPYSYEWTLTTPGKAPIVSNGPLAAGQAVPSMTFTAADLGNYTLSLKITDRDGNSTTQSRLLAAIAPTTPPIVIPPLVSLVGPLTGLEGSPLTFRGIQVGSTPMGSTSTYTWVATSANGQRETTTGTVGTSARVPDFTFTPFDNGTYTVSLTVTHNGIASTPDSIVVEIANVAPTPTITATTASVGVGSSATFGGSFSDPGGDFDAPYSFVWTATGPNNDVQTLTGTANSVGAVGNFAFVPTSKGVYSIVLKVTDIDGGTTTSQAARMLVTSVPVAVRIDSGPTTGSEGTPVTFSGSFTDPAGIARVGGYRIRWTATGNNGQIEVTETMVATPGTSTFSFSPRSGATYTVLMTVSDVDNTASTATRILTVANVAPTATVTTGPTTSPEGTPVSFGGSFTDPGMAFDGPYTYTWYATATNGQVATASGAVPTAGVVPAFALTPNDSGTYTITLTVVDRFGLTSVATRTMISTNVAPTATFGSIGKVAQGNALSFSFTNVGDVSSADLAAGATYSYDFTNSGSFTSPGNISGSRSASASHIFAAPGTYTVRGRIADKDGSFTDYTTQVTVLNRDTIVAGAGPGGGPHVRVLDAATGAEKMSFFAFDKAFTGGVNVASGDITGDGIADIVVAVASGGASHVRVFDGADGREIASFYAFGRDFNGGVSVAVADIDGDGHADIIVGAGSGGGPHVKVIDGLRLNEVDADGTIAESALLQSFFAFDKAFGGGVTVAAGDMDQNGRAEIAVGAGIGGGPAIGVFDGNTGERMQSFYAFDAAFTGGVNVSMGDIDGDGIGDLIVGAGPGGSPVVIAIDGKRMDERTNGGKISNDALLMNFMAYDAAFRGGVRVGKVDRDGDGSTQILTGPQQHSSERVFEYSGKPTEPKQAFDIFAGFDGGVSLG